MQPGQDGAFDPLSAERGGGGGGGKNQRGLFLRTQDRRASRQCATVKDVLALGMRMKHWGEGQQGGGVVIGTQSKLTMIIRFGETGTQGVQCSQGGTIQDALAAGGAVTEVTNAGCAHDSSQRAPQALQACHA